MLYCIIYQGKVTNPNKVAIVFKDKKLTYLELDTWIQSIQEKIKKYNRIAFIPHLSLESIVLIFAALRSNIKLCFLNQKNPAKYNKKIETFFMPDIVIHSIEELQKLTKKTPTQTPQITKISNEPCLLIPTSGSSSEPKIASLSYFNFLSNALVVNKKLNFTILDTWILALPLFHVAGISILFRVFSSKATLSIAHDKNLAKIKGNFISLVPTQLKLIFDAPLLYENKFKCILVGGALLSERLFFKAKKLNLPISMSYGMTEVASQILISNKPHFLKGLYYLGFPDKNCIIKLNKQNLLSVKGSSVFRNYYNQTTQFDWFETQDILRFHKDYGYAFFARANEMFISGGENIYPEEIERELLKYPGIKHAYVIGIQDDLFGHIPVAFILGEQYNTQKIRTKLLEYLPKYKVPTRFFKISLSDFNGLKFSREKLKKFVKSNKICL